MIVFSVIAAPFTQEEPEDTSAVGVETDEEEEEPAPPEEKPRFRGRLTDYYVINPATLGAYLKVTNTGDAPGKWSCSVNAEDESGTYGGFDFFSADKTLQPGDAIGGRITLTITNEGARYVTQTDVDCDPQ